MRRDGVARIARIRLLVIERRDANGEGARRAGDLARVAEAVRTSARWLADEDRVRVLFELRREVHRGGERAAADENEHRKLRIANESVDERLEHRRVAAGV